MNKRKAWKWTLALAVWFGLSTVYALGSTMYDEHVRWPIVAVLAVVFAALTVWLRSGVRKEDAELAEKKRAAEEAARKEREEREARLQADRERFKRLYFAVAGVTFKNDDRTDRQKVLREIALNEDGHTDVWLEADDREDDPGIRVLTDVGCVGYIRRSEKAAVRELLAHEVQPLWLGVELFTNDDGESIYRADVVFALDRENPKHKWYFDELQQSEV